MKFSAPRHATPLAIVFCCSAAFVSFGGALVAQNASTAATPQTAAAQAAGSPSSGPASAPQSASRPVAAETSGALKAPSANINSAAAAASAAQPTSAANASLTLQQQIAKLPPLQGTGLDVAVQQKALLAHLNAVLRFHRDAASPIQTVGEPSDVLYRDQASMQALQVAQLAFAAAKNVAALLGKIPEQPSASETAAKDAEAGQPTEAQRFAAARTRVQEQLDSLQQQQAAMQKSIAKAKAGELPALRQREEQLEGAIELQKATVEALTRVGSFSSAQQHTGLAGDIDRLQRSAPELAAQAGKPGPPPPLESLSAEHDVGVASQATVLFHLLSTRHSIDNLIKNTDVLRLQATDLRTPMLNILRSTVQQGQALSQRNVDLAGTPTSDAQDIAATRKQFDQLTATFQVLAQAALPLSQEVVLLEGQRTALTTWRTAVDAEYKLVLRGLLLRVLAIGIALGILALLSQLWARATVRYVHDLRRRRQLIVVRRTVVGFLSGLVLIFGVVTQFSSLATFAGFITAGIAVGLQSILLSVAAYFFIVGRYGVRVGDRITVAGVTGDVVEVGLVRFYLMELTGTGTELHSTGRVAVFANSVLFQTGTPLYKQLPGTEYAWHELTAKLKPNADAKLVADSIVSVVNAVYSGYSAHIMQQHRQVEDWMGTAIDKPEVSSRLQLTESGLQLAVLFPVEIDSAAEADQRIAESLMNELTRNDALSTAVEGTPVIKASIKT